MQFDNYDERKKKPARQKSITLNIKPKAPVNKVSAKKSSAPLNKKTFSQKLMEQSMAKAPQFDTSKAPKERPSGDNYTQAKHVEWALGGIRDRSNIQLTAKRNQQMRNMQTANMNNETMLEVNRNRMANNIEVQKLRNSGRMDAVQRDNNYENIRQQSNLMGRSNVAGANNLAKYQKSIMDNISKNGAESVLSPMLGQDVYDSLGEGEEGRVLQYMMATGGQMPPMKKVTEEGTFWDSETWVIDVPQKQQGQNPQGNGVETEVGGDATAVATEQITQQVEDLDASLQEEQRRTALPQAPAHNRRSGGNVVDRLLDGRDQKRLKGVQGSKYSPQNGNWYNKLIDSLDNRPASRGAYPRRRSEY